MVIILKNLAKLKCISICCHFFAHISIGDINNPGAGSDYIFWCTNTFSKECMHEN